MTTPSITLTATPELQYLLRLGDLCLIHAQRLGEWCGHAPILEEDIALTNMALDLIGQARAVLTHAGQRHAALAGGPAFDEDQLAFLREERDYLNPTLVELPHAVNASPGQRGERDFAVTVVRNLVVATWLRHAWQGLTQATDPELAAIAAKALKEARYHQQHAADWCVRLGDGTPESQRRLQRALDALWRYLPELFEDDAVDDWAAEAGYGPAASQLKVACEADLAAVLARAGLQTPGFGTWRSTGRRGMHSEHLGYVLAEMQSLQRAYPGGVW
ncbi:1,2-phenylacetyl-CoA epoxidase subunit PaaC [Ideonella livida]|uniref:Phenylacetate-CoA oxygenase subunit PaaC n=1 Tax=Ideonella livida TaxID=2707176 RepID=A0A7C9TNV4_9BURK|nr:1,2-phenylacetyl-CoA epoxidase subunit PaaC [Ideonella livida]NDY92886.1 phenylacetate-CoA oxygenase subunit PaaC [Ideonella livida]